MTVKDDETWQEFTVFFEGIYGSWVEMQINDTETTSAVIYFDDISLNLVTSVVLAVSNGNFESNSVGPPLAFTDWTLESYGLNTELQIGTSLIGNSAQVYFNESQSTSGSSDKVELESSTVSSQFPSIANVYRNVVYDLSIKTSYNGSNSVLFQYRIKAEYNGVSSTTAVSSNLVPDGVASDVKAIKFSQASSIEDIETIASSYEITELQHILRITRSAEIGNAVEFDDYAVTMYYVDSSNISLATNTSQGAQVSYTLYPNPVNDQLIISNKVSKIEVYNVLGQKLLEGYNVSSLNTSKLKSGTYTAKLSDNSGSTVSKRFIKN